MTEMKPDQAVEYIETVIAQCSVYMQRDARRQVLKAMDIIREGIDSITKKPEVPGKG